MGRDLRVRDVAKEWGQLGYRLAVPERGSESPGHCFEEQDWRVHPLGGHCQQGLLLGKGHMRHLVSMFQPNNLHSLHTTIVPNVDKRPMLTLRRSHNLVLLPKTKASHISAMLTVDLLPIGDLHVDHHLATDCVDDSWPRYRGQGLTESGQLDSVDPI
jgi:hypothetical protein